MRYAFSVFSPYRASRKASIFGSARTRADDPLYEQTRRLAATLAASGWMVVTGAGPGIMDAGIEGAGVDNAFGVSIRLPFEASTSQFLADDPKLINFRYFFTRKLIFVKESDAFVLLPGGFGTLDEAFETLTLIQTGKAQPRADRAPRRPRRHLLDHVARVRGARAARPRVPLADRPRPASWSPTTSTSRSTRRPASTPTTTRCASSGAASCCACGARPMRSSSPRSTTEFADIVERGELTVSGPTPRRGARRRRARTSTGCGSGSTGTTGPGCAG